MKTIPQRWPAMAIRFLFRERAAVSVLIAAGAGAALSHSWPFPEHNLVLRPVAPRTPEVYQALRVSDTDAPQPIP